MRPRPINRGMTLLEALLAVVILGAATTIAVGGMGAIQRLQEVEQHRLNATEVAHRLLLNHMIDPSSLPSVERPIAQGAGVYRYEIEESIVESEERGDRRSRRRARPMSEATGNQRLQAGLVQVTISVYRDAGGRPDLARGALAELSRIYDPFDTDEETIMFNQLESLMGIRAPAGRTP